MAVRGVCSRHVPAGQVTGPAQVTHPATLVVRAPPTYPKERRYIIDVVLSEWLGFDFQLAPAAGSTVSITLVGDSAARVVVLPDVLFSTHPEAWLTERALPSRPLTRLGAQAGRLPVLYGASVGGGAGWEETSDGVKLAVDVFGSAFHLLAGIEEIIRPVRDSHDRFPANEALSVVEGFIERPVVDEYVDLLWAAMRHVWPGISRRPSPYRLRLTHDIDLPWAAWRLPAAQLARSFGGDLLRRRDPRLAKSRIVAWFDGRSGRFDRDPYATYDFIMDTSERYGLRSLFYFMAGNGAWNRNAPYRLTDPPFEAILGRIHHRGHEVGLHASYESHESVDRVRVELLALVAACRAAGFEQQQWGVRQHYLRFVSPMTWRNQAVAGLSHDSSFGFAERVGFRAGTCREYPVFDALERRVLSLRERPLVAMDATLLGYLGLGLDDAAARLRCVADQCRLVGGDAVLLYHNDTLARSATQAHYRELVEELSPTVSRSPRWGTRS